MQYAQKVKNMNVAYIEQWDPEKEDVDNLSDACYHIPERRGSIPCWGVFFVIDETQTTYSPLCGLWNSQLKGCYKNNAPT